jgi:hypothetical protein
MENRSCLVIDAPLTRVSGHAERLAALEMIEAVANRPSRVTLGADKGYDAREFVEDLRELNVTPHIARNTLATLGHRRADDAPWRVRREPADSQRVEEAFAWIKTTAGLKQTKLRGLAKVDCAGRRRWGDPPARCHIEGMSRQQLPGVVEQSDGGYGVHIVTIEGTKVVLGVPEPGARSGNGSRAS